MRCGTVPDLCMRARRPVQRRDLCQTQQPENSFLRKSHFGDFFFLKSEGSFHPKTAGLGESHISFKGN